MEEHIAHSGAWGLAIIMIVGISWVFYRYVAPKNWHEWASAGVVQAFIIALHSHLWCYATPIGHPQLSEFKLELSINARHWLFLGMNIGTRC